MCGSACLPGGGVGSPALPLTSPPIPATVTGSSRAPTPRGCRRSPRGVNALSPEELPKGPADAGLAPATLPPRVNCSPPAPTGDARALPAPSSRGIPRVGGLCQEVPRLLHFPAAPTWKLSHRRPPSPAPLAGREPPQTPPPSSGETRAPVPQIPARTPWGQPRSHRSLRPGPTSFLGTHGRSRTAPHPLRLPSHPYVPTGPGPLGAGRAGLRACSQRLWLGLQLLLAPPPRPVPAA